MGVGVDIGNHLVAIGDECLGGSLACTIALKRPSLVRRSMGLPNRREASEGHVPLPVDVVLIYRQIEMRARVVIEIGKARYPCGLKRPYLVCHDCVVAIQITAPVRPPPLGARGHATAPEIGPLRLANSHIPALLDACLLQVEMVIDRFLRPSLAAGKGHRMHLIRIVEFIKPYRIAGILERRIKRLGEE